MPQRIPTDIFSRKQEVPDKWTQERKWFQSEFITPRGVAKSLVDGEAIKQYQEMIWLRPKSEYIEKFGSTVDELAALCSGGPEGWLCSSHIDWLMKKTSGQQDEAICLCLPGPGPKQLQEMFLKKKNVKRLFFVCNVGKNVFGKTYFATPQQGGSHWILVVVEINGPSILYCDSLGWACPDDLVPHFEEFTLPLGLSLTGCAVHMQHSVSKYRHICNDNCTNYPLQRCSNVCGIVSSVCAVIGALNITKFEELTSPCFATGTYLQDPTKYEKFLRRVIISWFMQEKVSLDLLFPKEVGIRNADPVVVSHDHNYAKIVRSEPNVQEKSLSPENFNSYSDCAMVEDFSQESISLSKQQGVKKPASETVSSFRKDSNDKKKNEKIKYECSFCSMVLGSRQALLKHKKR